MTQPILTQLEPGEALYIYLATSDKVVISIPIREEDDMQKFINFTS